MANRYSNVFSSSQGATAPEAGYQAPAGLQGYPKKLARLGFTGITAAGSVADTELFVLQPVDPRERLLSLTVTATAAFNAATTWTLDFGLWKLNANRTVGTVIDLNLFGTLVNIDATAIARVDVFTESTSLANIDRGKRIYELAEVTSTLTPDNGRGETWVIGAHNNISGAVTALGEIIVETELLPV